MIQAQVGPSIILVINRLRTPAMPAQRMFPSPVPLKDACTYAALTALHKICRKILHLIESLRPATLPRNLRVQAAPATFSRTHTEWWGGPFISKVKKKGME